ncbi:helix-turn-helix protein [Aneurinibacillus soli]|uniref:Uncharacterized protein n=1 Tax=Aneurinibacillus soli TaxID=1500254 RepID=A0A0U5B0K2_9BACL|nr:helix-turn-helix domain-containing protein [Aneurinibacillus soli]PYE64165.1 helix-turn-helix protein [Aneurinibacillus soli]BAU28114.1 hypothetical protein CB4_02288 [Aneurinibacillus soli]
MFILAKKFEVKVFGNIEVMNTIVDAFKKRIRGMLPASVMKVVDFLASHSCKVRGVSWATYEYMNDITGLSISTLKRAVKMLAKLGFIQVIRTWVGGCQSANIIQIQPRMDWKAIETELMRRVRFEYADEKQSEIEKESEEIGENFLQPNDTQSETKEDMQSDTLYKQKKEGVKAAEPIDEADFWGVPDYIPTTDINKNNSNLVYHKIKGFHPSFNWLDQEE